MTVDDAQLERLGIFHLDNTVLYTTTTEELPILIMAGSNFTKNTSILALFHMPTFYTGAKTFLLNLKTGTFDHLTDTALKFIEFSRTPMSHTHMKSIRRPQMFSNCMTLHTYGQMYRKEAWKTRSDTCQVQIIPKCAKIISGPGSAQAEAAVIEKNADLIPHIT